MFSRRILPILGLLLTSYAAAVDLSQFTYSPDVINVKISPTGEYLALQLNRDGRYMLAFVNRADGSTTGGVKFRAPRGVGEFFWVNDERVVMQVVESSAHDEAPKYYGELYASDYDGGNSEMIFGYRAEAAQKATRIRQRSRDYSWAHVVDDLSQDPRNILISVTPWDRERALRPRLQRLDVYRGLDSRPRKFARYPQASFFTDEEGNARVVTSRRPDGTLHVETRPDPDGDWRELDESRFGTAFVPAAVTDDGKSIYVIDNIDHDRTGLYKLALDGSTYEHIYTNDSVDITDLQRTVDGNGVFAIRVDPGYPTYLLFSQDFAEARIFKQLLASFPGRTLSITSRTRDGRYWVVRTGSDIDPGSFYLYDDKKQQLQLIFTAREDVDPGEMASSEPVEFQSFDGRTITGYFTPAKNREGIAPMVVLVHGGPPIRDFWEFDPTVQALATHGFSVLRINFRGSAGFGREFESVGYREWGGDIQRDIHAGTRWALENGKAEEGRVCIMGASFGGYSAIQSATMEPDLYRCVVAEAGVYDLSLIYSEGDIEYTYGGRSYLEKAIGEDESQLRAYSPVHRAEHLKAPVFLIHGEQDHRAPYAHARAMIKALEEEDRVFQTLIQETEGHGFYNEANQVERYKEIINFLSTHLRPSED
ncbi:alpha/beta hydrolase family protein [Gilvimarinus sp. F26214L]|uniref:alpha/beta hydrolase family protein n=1 Tax=Gilvimarinus sp. DZF01 TaxID=3461371 RepID=UPI004045FF42